MDGSRRGWTGLSSRESPASLNVDEFNDEMRSFLPRIDFQHILAAIAGKVELSEDTLAAEQLRTYVRQLQLIEGSDEDVFEAINQFLRSAAERSAWSKQGLVHEKSFDEYEEALISAWKNKRSLHNITHNGHSSVNRGKLLLADCGLSISKSFRGWSHHPSLPRAAFTHLLKTRLLVGTLNTRNFSAPERTMAILNREVRAIQNPALGSILIWRAASSYQKTHLTSDFMPLPLAFLVLPILYHEETASLVTTTRTASGLRKLTEKFRSARRSQKTDLLLAVGGRATAMRELSWESLRLGPFSPTSSPSTRPRGRFYRYRKHR